MRIEKRHGVWTNGEQFAIVWEHGHLCVYGHNDALEGPELVSWLAPDEPDWSGRPPEPMGHRWEELTGWPEGAVEAAGAWSLVEEGEEGLRLVGPKPIVRPEPVVVPMGLIGAAAGALPRDTSLFSRKAVLVDSPEGPLLLDVAHGLVWSLEAGVLLQLAGVGARHKLAGVRVAGGVVLHLSLSEQGKLLRISDAGQVSEGATTEGPVCPLHVGAEGAVWSVLTQGGSWWTPSEADLDTPVGAQRPVRLDPLTLQVEVAAGEVVLDPSDWSAASAGTLWVLCGGRMAVVLSRREGAWALNYEIKRPSGDPARTAGRPRLAPAKPLTWEGPPGPFRAEGVVRNIGKDLVGADFLVRHSDIVQITHITYGGERLTVRDGLCNFARTSLRYEHPVPIVLEGRASAPGAVAVTMQALSFSRYKKKHPDRLGEIVLEVTVEGGLVAVRGEERLQIQPEWTAQLGRGGALDGGPQAPDLSRWVRRALARCRVDRVEEDRAGVLKEWLRMTERDRKATGVKMPAYKLSSGFHWVVLPEEAERIVRALGEEHPLGAFAMGGSFEVQGGDPLGS